jgi:cytochrome c553/sugar lactone lactonase YvrE
MNMTRQIWFAIAMTATSSVALADEDDWEEGIAPLSFETRPIGGARPGEPTPAYLTSSRIAALGDGAFAIDADSGMLARVDQGGKPRASLAIGHDAGLLVYDPAAHLVYVADRRGDRIVVANDALEVQRSWRTPAEPYGIALTPDRKHVLVTAIADRTLVAYDTEGHEAWRTALSAEPRGVAVSPDGKRAMVGTLSAGVIDEIALATHRRTRIALPTSGTLAPARGAYAVTFLGNHLAVSAFQQELTAPGEGGQENTGSYGGGFSSPITGHLAFMRDDGKLGSAQVALVLPRSLAWDGTHDVLYVAAMGTGTVFGIERASQVDPSLMRTFTLDPGCGADGLAAAPDGDLLVWCALTREVDRVHLSGKGGQVDDSPVKRGVAIAPSALSPEEHTGMALFHTATFDIAAGAGAACASCHQDGRADGLSWRIGHKDLQTPMLAGRIAETAPYKWDGTAKTLEKSLAQTVKRLGGEGLSRKDLAALAAYVRALPAVRTPTRDPAAVARGKQLFDSGELGCTSCHAGPAFTDQSRHRFSGTLTTVDTPGLAGLAASAPYFHDGSAPTLEAVLRDRGGVHGMTDPAQELSDAQVADLVAFLESL